MAAASIISAPGGENNCHPSFLASSTTAELGALNLAADQLAELLPPSAIVFSDSRAALLTIARKEHGSSIVQCLMRRFTVLVRSGCAVSFQWVPSHLRVRSNEAADALAKDAHDSWTLTTNFTHSFDVVRQIIARHVGALHPNPCTASRPAIPSHACH